MACIKLSLSFDSYGRKKFNFPSPNVGYYCGHISGTHAVNLSNKDKQLSISRELSDAEQRIDNVNGTENENSVGVIEIKKLVSANKSLKFGTKVLGSEAKRYFRRNDGALVGGVSIQNLSLEICNAELKRLESSDDSRTLEFFALMRRNGKLVHNATGYNLALRVLGRKRNWGEAERLIEEMQLDSGCEIDYQIFNTLIYACCKHGLKEVATKWFRKMLDLGVSPNIATFGMLMSLYQKGWNVSEAEFAFSQMRKYEIQCQSAYSSLITIYTRLNLYEKAEEVIAYLEEDKVKLNLENWLVLLNAYSQQGKMQKAEQVLVLMQEAGFQPNIVAYNTLITGYGKVSNMKDAQRVFRNLRNVALKPDESTYRSMIEGWGRADNYQEAEWYYKELKQSGFEPNSSNLYTLINLQAKYDDEEGAVRSLQDMTKMGCQYAAMLGILLQAYEKAGRVEKVPLIIKGSFFQHILVNPTSCSVLVMAYVKYSLIQDAIKVLAQKKWKDEHFEDNLYHLLICSCKESGNFENAIRIYDQMPVSKDKPNIHIISTMIDVYSSMGLFTKAEKLYLELKSSGVSLDLVAFSIVIRMYVKAGSLTDACAVLETMASRKDIVPDVYLYRDMLRIYQQCAMLDKLADLYYKLLKSGIAWDEEMYNCVINCCARALPVDELSRLFNEMLQCGFLPNTITFNVMLDAYGKSKSFKKARKLFWMAQKWGLVDIISYNTLVSAYGQNKDLRNMSATYNKMRHRGFTDSLEVYNCMLDAYGKAGKLENFRRVLQRLKGSSHASDLYTYNILLNIYGEKGLIEEVADVLKEMKECGLGLNLCSYNTLIKAYGIAGMVEDAMSLLKEMRVNGIKPDKITYVNLISALRRNDQFLEAVKWSLWMKQMGL